MLELENKLASKSYKFGVLYCGPKQKSEEEILANNGISADFQEFLNFLGQEITLKGYQGFSGGLDTKQNATGQKTIVSKIRDYEIMFHVAQFLPFSECDSQQLGRKRHIGNDIVLFIFKEDKEPLDVSTFVSEMNHVFIVVHKCKEVHDTAATRYLVNFASKGGVHSFAPQLPYPPVFEKTNVFRRFLLTKAINSERAALCSPSFLKRISLSRKTLLNDVASKCAVPEMPSAKGKSVDFRVHGNGREPVVASKKGIPRRKSFTSDKAHLGRNRSTSIGCSQDALIKKRASVVDKQEVAAASHERKLAFLEHQLNEALNEIDHLKLQLERVTAERDQFKHQLLNASSPVTLTAPGSVREADHRPLPPRTPPRRPPRSVSSFSPRNPSGPHSRGASPLRSNPCAAASPGVTSLPCRSSSPKSSFQASEHSHHHQSSPEIGIRRSP